MDQYQFYLRNNTLFRYTTWYGTMMGLFWLAKFTLIPAGFAYPNLILLFLGLTFCVPFIVAYWGVQYRKREFLEDVSMGRMWSFIFLIYLYASLLTALGHYFYFRFMDGGYMLHAMEEMVKDFVATLPAEQGGEIESQMGLMIEQQRQLSPIETAINQLSQNLLTGMLMAFIIAPLIRRKRSGEQTLNPKEIKHTQKKETDSLTK